MAIQTKTRRSVDDDAHAPIHSSSNDTVSVGCKLPNGLHLDHRVPGQPLQRVTLRGSNAANVVGGFGITTGVPREFWDHWLAKHQELPAVRNGLVFAHVERASTIDEAKEKAQEVTGIEPLDPKKPAKGIKPLKATDSASDSDED